MMYEKTKNELYAEKWFKDHGFQFALVKQYYSKTKYNVSKDDITDNFELLSGITDIEQYMKAYEKDFKMKQEIVRLKKQLESR